MVINSLTSELVRIGRFQSMAVEFLWVGHTKTDVDLLFAGLVLALSGQDYFNLE